ncbi:MAG: AarF/ABC1/UbiB kinase family protein [Myxococcales bacterium]|nr:AarF/ABC1/UbiB kinase family protein [Polyangiaceae bacterium]MDW8250207.1 AarF/ABC1/UbiB kinase family protein [Myxococcales bacterium]
MVSLVTAYRDLVRLREIYIVLVKHGFGELAARLGLSGRRRTPRSPDAPPESEPPPSSRGITLEASAEDLAQGQEELQHISLAARVRLVAQDLGPSFVKLAQIASTRTDILPPEMIAELKKLQDGVAPIPFEEVQRQIEASLQRPLHEIYEHFDPKPLAAASIGQVHRAVLRTAEGPCEVVVKVQRPGVAQTIARDLDLLHMLAALIERTIPESHIYQPRAMVENFDRTITAELDYTLEADNTRRFIKNFEKNPHARFPKVYTEASSRHVLTLEYLPGIKIYDAIQQGFDAKRLVRIAIGIIIQQAFEDGFFHADPHPGNILILGTPDAPQIGMIDLGMVGRLSAEMRDKVVNLMLAAARQDSVGVADALYALGTPTRKIDMRAYRAEASLLAEKYLGRPLGEIDLTSLIRDLVQGASKYGIEISSDFLIAGKALMTIEGVGKEVDPSLDIYTETRPYFLELLRKRYSPERVMNEAWRGLERLSSIAYDLPQQAQEILEDLRLGRLQMKASSPELPHAFDRLGRRAFSGLVIAAFTVGGSLLADHDRTSILGFGMLGIGVITLILHLLRDLRT